MLSLGYNTIQVESDALMHWSLEVINGLKEDNIANGYGVLLDV